MLGHHAMLKKGPALYEDMVRVPLLISAPSKANSLGNEIMIWYPIWIFCRLYWTIRDLMFPAICRATV